MKLRQAAKRADDTRVATLDEREVLRDAAFRTALAELARRQGRALKDVEGYAEACLDELAVRPADRYLGWVASLARFMITRSFEPEFDVNGDAIDRLKELAKTRPLVFLWSHKSHLDSFVFMRALYDADFRPQPLSFAGINMNFAGFGALARHSGAIFLRRSFKEDEVYKLVFRHFIDYLVRIRVPLSWSIEGTRSRTGKLMPPKLGLIQWVVDSYRRASCDDVLFVPVAISFDQIPEIEDYIAMQRGLPKRKESLKWFIDYVAGMKSNYGRIYVRFADPVSLSDSLSVSGALLSADESRAQVQKLAFEVCNRIEHAKPINATDLVTLVLLAGNGRALDQGQIHRHARALVDLVRRRGLPTVAGIDGGDALALGPALDALVATGVLERTDRGGSPVYLITPGRQLAAAYYRNTIVHYFLSSAIAEVALTAAAGRSEQVVLEVSLALRDLLKFEFFFKNRTEFSADVAAFLDHRYAGWREGRTSPDAHCPPLFGHAILRSFLEAYWILAKMLQSRGDLPVAEAHEAAIVEGCLEHGEELLLRREISTESALSQPLFETALRLARHRGLLDGAADSLGLRRDAFVCEIDAALGAINHLQQVYDAGLAQR